MLMFRMNKFLQVLDDPFSLVNDQLDLAEETKSWGFLDLCQAAQLNS